ncbi:hypothetical protein [Thalassobacterium maritimum]|uniref:hypothetical protein n=1 Tax=Thalassobacterium maritimum TaxID=3041265 RepID=UPI002811EE45|nr:hypothetical protein [Coraliomargarita sp. SDUM461003]
MNLTVAGTNEGSAEAPANTTAFADGSGQGGNADSGIYGDCLALLGGVFALTSVMLRRRRA